MNRLRRSMLFLPGANAAMLSTAFIYRPDSIMFDLEDAVALRETARACWSGMRSSTRCIRISKPWCALTR
jgi:citrate lyase beta subunit